ncbi:sporulation protein YjcA [Halobacillus andaensis]|uniref:Sporulation protein YjcA n=1 Tax=Halobacillus andaensis TaxID=1176239 RepID=A0A917EW87_HALAA|nr:DUF1360 domain-containing protein [Halobacillus andaensis]MBP2004032.1 hypothetical protein [Halobacillus andaensis]GGF15280.1 sporulation protein YjcA [Halobacillus andaensis]
MVTGLELFLIIFATFRVTKLIVQDVIFEPLRAPFFTIVQEGTEEWLEPKGVIGELVSCQWCVGVWASLFVIFLHLYVPYSELFILILAVAGIQSIIYEWSRRNGE